MRSNNHDDVNQEQTIEAENSDTKRPLYSKPVCVRLDIGSATEADVSDGINDISGAS